MIRGKFKSLGPVLGKDGVWRVGGHGRGRMPFADSEEMPVLIPRLSAATKLLMKRAHEVRHGGQDETLSEFRKVGFWAVNGGKVAKACSSRKACRKCQKYRPEPLKEVMGEIPKEVMEQGEAWECVQLDLMGPFQVRSDVNTRSRMKVWGMVLEDVGSGSVHLEVL